MNTSDMTDVDKMASAESGSHLSPLRVRIAFVAKLVASAVRIVLGLMWLYQGLFKIQAGFGGSDVLLVVQSTAGNSRVPEFFKGFTHGILGESPDLFGVMIPLVEIGLGAALVLGILTLPAAIGAVFTLVTYWLSDQLIWEYPIMVLLSVAVLVWDSPASTFSLTSLALRLHRRRASTWLKFPASRWL